MTLVVVLAGVATAVGSVFLITGSGRRL